MASGVESLNPTQSFSLSEFLSLSLAPRIRLLLTVHRGDKSVSPLDEWKLKTALLNYLLSAHPITIDHDDVSLTKPRAPNKRKRDDPLARGSICVTDLGFLGRVLGLDNSNENVDKGVEVVEKRFREWMRGFDAEMDGIQLSLERVKFRLTVEFVGTIGVHQSPNKCNDTNC